MIKTSYKKIAIILTFIAIILLGITTTLLPKKNVEATTYYDSGYKIENYNIDINVSENNVLKITEEIKVNFLESSHGIIRKIPIINTLEGIDRPKTKSRYVVSNVKYRILDEYGTNISNDVSSYSESNNFYNLQLGSNNYIKGIYNFHISYDYNLGIDPIKNGDEFYFNLIGNQWDTTIENVVFKITMPKTFEYTSDSMGMYYGPYKSNYDEGLSYEVYGNVISGSLSKQLDPWSGLTIRIELPEDYFVGETDLSFTPLHKLALLIFGAILILTSIIFLIIKSKNRVIKTVEFFPPEDMSSLELAFNYKGKVNYNDISSLIVYFANKGYLTISEETKKIFSLKKVAEYDGNSKFEKAFFDYIFEESDTISSKALENRFSKASAHSFFSKLKKDINSKERQSKILHKSAKSIKNLYLIFFGISSFIMIFLFISTIIGNLIFAVIPTLIAMVFMYYLPYTSLISYEKTHEQALTVTQIITAFVGVCLNLYYFFSPNSILQFNLWFLFLIALMIFANVALILASRQPLLRTQQGKEILGKILGFKDFLIKAEKPQLEKLVLENPNYYYNILPYTYVLHVSKKWMDKFELIPLNAPDWYEETSLSPFTFMGINNLVSISIRTTRSTLKSNAYKQTISKFERFSGGSGGGGSSFGGGGFSGGGGGGGGGSRW